MPAERKEAHARHKIEDCYWKNAIHPATFIAEIGTTAFDEFALTKLMDLDKGLNCVTIC